MNAIHEVSLEQMPIEEAEDEIDLKQYWLIINKHKWGIFSFVLAVFLLTLPIVFSLTPIYQSNTKLLIDPQKSNVVSVEEVYGLPGSNTEYFETQIEVLKSRTLAEKVVEKLNLQNREGFFPEKKPLLGFDWQSMLPEGWLAESEGKPSFDGTVGFFSKNLSAVPVRKTQLVEIKFASHNPAIAAEVSNTLAEVYIENDLEARLQMTQKAASWLTERLEALRLKLEKSEKALQAYMEREQLVDVSGVKSLSASRLNVLNTRLVEARRARAEAQAVLEQIERARQRGSSRLDSLPAVMNHSVVQNYRIEVSTADSKVSELKKRYGPKHPKMIQATSELQSARSNLYRQIQNVINGVKKEYETAIANERDLERELAGAKQEVQGVSKKQYQLDVLQREVDANRSLYDMFLTRFKETSETGGIESANARILDLSKIPGTPYKPKKKQIVIITMLLALMTAVGAAFLYERLDDTVKGSADIENKLGLPVLGLLQKLKTRGKKDRSPLSAFVEDSQSAFAESIRTIRTGVLLSSLDNPHKIIMVTSSLPSEGKSTVAMNLAYALSNMSKVLLIDADMRRPSIAESCDLGTSAKGLSQFTAGTAKISETMHKLSGSDLAVMPAGLVPPNPLELLSSNKFQEALDSLSRVFDHIVIDTAPAIAVSDSLVISKYANAVIYVVQADSTPYQVAASGVTRLKRVGAPVIGAVLNKLAAEKKGRYGYYGADYYTGYGYTKDA